MKTSRILGIVLIASLFVIPATSRASTDIKTLQNLLDSQQVAVQNWTGLHPDETKAQRGLFDSIRLSVLRFAFGTMNEQNIALYEQYYSSAVGLYDKAAKAFHAAQESFTHKDYTAAQSNLVASISYLGNADGVYAAAIDVWMGQLNTAQTKLYGICKAGGTVAGKSLGGATALATADPILETFADHATSNTMKALCDNQFGHGDDTPVSISTDVVKKAATKGTEAGLKWSLLTFTDAIGTGFAVGGIATAGIDVVADLTQTPTPPSSNNSSHFVSTAFLDQPSQTKTTPPPTQSQPVVVATPPPQMLPAPTTPPVVQTPVSASMPGCTLVANRDAIIDPGTYVEITWVSWNADEASLDHGTGTVQPSGMTSVNPSQTTTYTLSVKHGKDTGQCSITVRVNAASQNQSTVTTLPIAQIQPTIPPVTVTLPSGPIINPLVFSSPSTGIAGTTFNEPGRGFTPNSTAILHFRKPDGTEFPTRSVQTDASGNYENNWNSSSSSLVGTYSYWAIDSTGRMSSTATFQITAVQLPSPTQTNTPVSPPIVPVTPSQTLSVNLITNPYQSSLWTDQHAQLTAIVSGTAVGSIHYQFDCTNNGGYEEDVVNDSHQYIENSCSYPSAGTYIARVHVERGTATPAESTVRVVVVSSGAAPVAPTPAQSVNPTLSLSPTSGAKNTRFTFYGYSFTPSGGIQEIITKPDGTRYPPNYITADPAGKASKTYDSSTASLFGAYSIYWVDQSTGKQSNTVQETISVH